MQMNGQNPTGNDGLNNPVLLRILVRKILAIDQCRRKSPRSGKKVPVYLRLAWLSMWVLLNAAIFSVHRSDVYIAALFTLAVSVQALLLVAIALLAQNRVEREVDSEVRRMQRVHDALQETLGVEMETKPENLLAEFEWLQRCNPIAGSQETRCTGVPRQTPCMRFLSNRPGISDS